MDANLLTRWLKRARVFLEVFLDTISPLREHKDDAKHQQAITNLAASVTGVCGVNAVSVSRFGFDVEVSVGITTRSNPNVHKLLKAVIDRNVREYLIAQEFDKIWVKLYLDKPEPHVRRVAVALKMYGMTPNHIVDSFTGWSHLALCEVEDGEIVRATLCPDTDVSDLKSFLKRHHVQEFVLFDPNKQATVTAPNLTGVVTLRRAPCADPRLIGLKL